MEYLRIMRQALDTFGQQLAQEEIRINKLVGEGKKLEANRDKLKEEVESLTSKQSEFDAYIAEKKAELKAESNREAEAANELTAKAHALFETSKKEGSQAKVLLAQAEQDSGKVAVLKDAWDKKTKDLAAVIRS